MKIVTENIIAIADDIKADLKELLIDYSEIYRWNPEGSIIISTAGNYSFNDLSDQGHQLQSKIITDYKRYYELLSFLFSGVADDSKRLLDETDKCINRTIQQERTHCQTTDEALSEVEQALDSQINILSHLYDSSSGEYIIVPDTNVLLYNPDIEDWTIPKIKSFRIVLTPTVLSELDKLKINHRNEDVRQKSKKLIRKFKEYRRRGSLIKGVKIIKNKILLQAVATEPNMDKTLQWLDKDNQDDRLIASCLEITRNRPKSIVVLYSMDINVQNKAEMAGLSVMEIL